MNRYRNLTGKIIIGIVFFLGLTQQLHATPPQRDTVYIYETVTVYDTLTIIKSRKQEVNEAERVKPLGVSIPVKWTAEKKAPAIAATIPYNSIIDSESIINKPKTETMKRQILLGLAIISFQGIANSQNYIGVNAGGGAWWSHNVPLIEFYDIQNIFWGGVFLNRTVPETNYRIRLGVNYQLSQSENNYFSVEPPNRPISRTLTINDERSGYFGYKQLSIPVTIERNRNRVSPFFGFEHSYRWTHLSQKNEQNNSMYSTRFGLLCGVNVGVIENLDIRFIINIGVNKEIVESKLEQGISSHSYGNSMVGLSASYGLWDAPAKPLNNLSNLINSMSDTASRDYKYSIMLRMGIATQIYTFPSISEVISGATEKNHGKTIDAFIPVTGVGMGASIPWKGSFELKPQVSYIQKGTSLGSIQSYSSFTTDSSSLKLVSPGNNNRFHYLSLDFTTKYQRQRSQRKVQRYLQVGIRGDILAGKTIEYTIRGMGGDGIGYAEFNRFNVGAIYSFGLDFNKLYYLELEINRDIGFLVKNTSLKVRNHLISFNLGINL